MKGGWRPEDGDGEPYPFPGAPGGRGQHAPGYRGATPVGGPGEKAGRRAGWQPPEPNVGIPPEWIENLRRAMGGQAPGRYDTMPRSKVPALIGLFQGLRAAGITQAQLSTSSRALDQVREIARRQLGPLLADRLERWGVERYGSPAVFWGLTPDKEPEPEPGPVVVVCDWE
jgi:hypothetical protein